MKIQRNNKILLLCIFCILFLYGYSQIIFFRLEEKAHFIPDYPMTDISTILKKEDLTTNDYATLFEQTGLGISAIDYYRSQHTSIDTYLIFQQNFFEEISIDCIPNSPISKEEYIVDENGVIDYTKVKLGPLQKGDILITSASHIPFWRNGHAALLVDAKQQITLEAIVIGENSSYQSLRKWKRYPNFIVLRLKDSTSKERSQIAETAIQYLNDIPYHLLVGILTPKEKAAQEIDGTHCSHLIWEAYYLNGYDIDSNGGKIVSPEDIANSNLLEVVQIYGLDPNDYLSQLIK